MLLNVSGNIAKMARNIIKNHPNAFECQAIRRHVVRSGAGELGGMAVLSSSDEHEVEFLPLGAGYVLPADQFQGGKLYDSGDAVYGDAGEFSFLIEPEFGVGEEGHWSPRKQDIVYLVITNEIKLAFELVGHSAPLNMPPYSSIWTANRVTERDIVPEMMSLQLLATLEQSLSEGGLQAAASQLEVYSAALTGNGTDRRYRAFGYDLTDINIPIYFEIEMPTLREQELVVSLGMSIGEASAVFDFSSPADTSTFTTDGLAVYMVLGALAEGVDGGAFVISPQSAGDNGVIEAIYSAASSPEAAQAFRIGVHYRPDTKTVASRVMATGGAQFAGGISISNWVERQTLMQDSSVLPLGFKATGTYDGQSPSTIKIIADTDSFVGGIPSGATALDEAGVRNDVYSLGQVYDTGDSGGGTGQTPQAAITMVDHGWDATTTFAETKTRMDAQIANIDQKIYFEIDLLPNLSYPIERQGPVTLNTYLNSGDGNTSDITDTNMVLRASVLDQNNAGGDYWVMGSADYRDSVELESAFYWSAYNRTVNGTGTHRIGVYYDPATRNVDTVVMTTPGEYGLSSSERYQFKQCVSRVLPGAVQNLLTLSSVLEGDVRETFGMRIVTDKADMLMNTPEFSSNHDDTFEFVGNINTIFVSQFTVSNPDGNNSGADSDNDGVLDSADAFPADPNEWLDTDGDGVGNIADTDDDGDGVSDADEIAAGYDPLDPNSAPPQLSQVDLQYDDTLAQIFSQFGYTEVVPDILEPLSWELTPPPSGQVVCTFVTNLTGITEPVYFEIEGRGAPTNNQPLESPIVIGIGANIGEFFSVVQGLASGFDHGGIFSEFAPNEFFQTYNPAVASGGADIHARDVAPIQRLGVSYDPADGSFRLHAFQKDGGVITNALGDQSGVNDGDGPVSIAGWISTYITHSANTDKTILPMTFLVSPDNTVDGDTYSGDIYINDADFLNPNGIPDGFASLGSVTGGATSTYTLDTDASQL
ncbi:MAG: hypothetical protein CMB99_00730 [Flavobacteriaceae bacterium]|nr:hypothetical protein [Flavobacteriaceae bacterium]